ncbi:MAG TPA: YraN family protein [Thermoleophilaceae bacterium]|nr:YraN family protein [Thermoleophilaceae bacterium]
MRPFVTERATRSPSPMHGVLVADPRRARGAAGEEAAAELLASFGYEILERNFRTKYGELDIVAVDRETLVFCEVRARVGRDAIAYALESIGPGKRMQLRKMAREWFRLSTAQLPATRTTRFDAIAVAMTRDGRVVSIEHVRDAF